jgi:histidine ammonia-lyase
LLTEKSLRVGADALTVDDVAAVGRRATGHAHEFDVAASNRVDRSVALKNRLIRTGRPIYGVTTGFGDSNTHQISPEKAAELQRNLITYHLVGSGPTAEPAIVRATMLIRANCLARGYSGVRGSVIRLLLDCLERDILPIIPERGSVGASGDLVPLCYLAALLTGQGDALAAGRVRPAAEALAASGLAPVTLEPKEALALINGTSFMSAFAAQAVHDAAELAYAADVCTALCSETLLGNRGHFDAMIHEQKPHPGQVRSAGHVRGLLRDSKLSRHHEQVLLANPELGERSYLRLEQAIQDRYSIRCAPHVIGVLHDTLDWARTWVETEINSTNDNPLFDPGSEVVHNGGNFYGGHIGQAMDALKVAVASVGDLLDRQLALVVDEKFNNGLTANLIPVFGDDDMRRACITATKVVRSPARHLPPRR